MIDLYIVCITYREGEFMNNTQSAMPRKMKAEMWDRMQFLFRNYYDRMIHFYLKFDQHLDFGALSKAFKYVVDRITVLHSSFVNSPITPYWKINYDYTEGDILVLKEAESEQKAYDTALEFLTQEIPVKAKMQIQTAIIRTQNSDTLVVVLNHMCMDGPDTKEMLMLVAKAYDQIVAGNEPDVQVKNGDRSHYQCYTLYNDEEKKKALGLYKNVSQVKYQIKFPYTKRDHKVDKSRILRRVIGKEKFAALKAVSKSVGVTLNDMLLVAYMRCLYRACNINKESSVSVPCMVDLRRHIKGGKSYGFSNHIGFMICTAHGYKEDYLKMFEDIKKQSDEAKEDPFFGLYSLPLLNLAYTLFPQCLAEIAIGIGYNNPYTGMSNLGLLKEQDFEFNGQTPCDLFITGAIKSIPYLQLAVSTYKGEMTLTIAVKCKDEDEKALTVFIDDVVAELDRMIETIK